MPLWSKISFQDSNSPLMEHLIFFHDHRMVILATITIITFYLIISSAKSLSFNRFFLEAQEIELFWTSLPALILLFIAMPSLKTLYLIEENISPLVSIKGMGYQWNWGYQYSSLKDLNFSSLIIKSLSKRLIETSNHLVLPVHTPSRIVITSKDVLHSWTIPSLGVKADATPGRINQVILIINRPGILIGQCSEICGAGHRFIPISLEATSIKIFIKNI